VLIGDDHTCCMERIGTVLIRMFDGMVRELKDIRYIPQLKKNLISIGDLEPQGLKGTLEDGIIKILKGSIVVLKGIRLNNMYYLKNSTVTEQVMVSERVNNGSPDCGI